jgi:hypothetical protein
MSVMQATSSVSSAQDAARIYLIVADETEEFGGALRYASRMARNSGARIAILYTLAEQGFSFWGNVEEHVRAEQRQEAEQFLKVAAARITEIDGLEPLLLLEEGEPVEAILRVIATHPSITQLILGGNTHARTPGPLVSYFTSGRGLARLSVPLTIVPDNIPPENIDELF